MVPQLLALILVSVGGHAAATGVAAIDAACAAPGPRADAGRTRFFVETSGAVLPRGRQGEWRELGSEEELHELSDGPKPPNTEATVRVTRGGTLVSMYFQDGSASWAHVVDYCFRKAGPLARVQGTFNSYRAGGGGPGIRRRRTTYYGADGAVLQSRTGVFDLETDAPVAKAQFLDEEDPLYPTVRALPFSSDLLPPLPPANPDPDGFVAAVRERLPAIKACFERAVKAKPGVAGKAVGRWTVDEAGKVAQFSWESNEIKSPLFASCAQRVIESWRFPARERPASVSFPFVFEQPGAGLSLTP
ncbi:MAG TPA: AgmX/PglI C-terminal domain-containing protein [Polyangia bacterium]|nr:AgmX/PglI C-terminal domain-containing protein [Polyangia bacterium]